MLIRSLQNRESIFAVRCSWEFKGLTLSSKEVFYTLACRTTIPAIRRPRQEGGCELKASLGYMVFQTQTTKNLKRQF